MEKVIEIAKNVAIVILALIVAFILFIGLGKLATFAFSSLASAGASLTSVFVPATTTPAIVVAPGNSPATNAPGTYSTSSAVMTNQNGTTQTYTNTTSNTNTTNTTGYTYPTTQTHTTYVAPRVSYYGLPDLSASVISTGIVNSAGVFIPQTVVYEGQRAAAQILVTNIGTNVSGSWILQAPLPTNQGGEVFTSVAQPSLAPGASAKLTLSFDDLRDVNVSSMVVTIDPYNQIAESNKSNNQVVATFQKNLSYTNAGYNYTYPTNYTTNYTNAIYSNGSYYNAGYNTTGYVGTNNNGVYYNNGSYYVAPTYTYPYTTYDGNWNSSNSLPDLTASIVSVNNQNNTYGTTYYNGSSYYSGNPETLQVQITNNGGSTAYNYSFNASINGSVAYTSPSEPSLAPGQSAIYTVNLNSTYSNGNTVTVTVNPYNSILESNYSNNTVTQSF